MFQSLPLTVRLLHFPAFYAFSRYIAFFLGVLVCLTLADTSIAARECDGRLKNVFMGKSWKDVQELRSDPRCVLEARTATWFALKKGIIGPSMDDYIRFIESASDWPWMQVIRRNAENVASSAPDKRVVEWFRKNPPKTFKGIMAYLDALIRMKSHDLGEVRKKIWIESDMDTGEEKAFLARHGKYLNHKIHWGKFLVQLKKKNIEGAGRILEMLSPAERRLGNVRLGLLKGDEGAGDALVSMGLSPEKDHCLALDYLYWLRKRKDPRAFQFLLRFKEIMVHDPKALWKETHILARRAIEEAKYMLALKMIQGHQLKPGSEFAEAEWLRGWLTLKHARQPDKATHIFEELYQKVSTPVSKAKAAWWLGRAYEFGNSRQARKWYGEALRFPTTFYGQQAARILGAAPVLKRTPLPSSDVRAIFDNRELVRVVKLLAGFGFQRKTRDFLFMLVKTVPVREKILVVRLASAVDPEWTVAVAREASRFGEILTEEAYPLLPPSLMQHVSATDKALVHAVIRKESQFDPMTKSPVGALGLMQVMPETGRIIAEKIKLGLSSPSHLKSPPINIKLGSAYLQKQLEDFDHALVLAVCAYNAGPRNVRAWIGLFGDPRQPGVDIIDWIEQIPFGETRNYVQRVLESYGIYLSLLHRKG